MERRDQVELMDDPSLPEELLAAAHRDLARVHRWLGNTAALLALLRQGPEPVRSVLDIGCGRGALLEELRAELGVEVVGFDLRPAPASAPVRILAGNAVVDPLPQADVALAVCLVHHLGEAEIVGLVRNVSRSCKRLIVLDLVRHRLPLTLFGIFAPLLLQRINVADGLTSIRRAYTPEELARIVGEALRGADAELVQCVAPGFTRQVLDIRWRA
jgi:2-polyprenyl-3-methyl-5-hydroxy-6-metoxy-1,4-benzoquinol methylase